MIDIYKIGRVLVSENFVERINAPINKSSAKVARDRLEAFDLISLSTRLRVIVYFLARFDDICW